MKGILMALFVLLILFPMFAGGVSEESGPEPELESDVMKTSADLLAEYMTRSSLPAKSEDADPLSQAAGTFSNDADVPSGNAEVPPVPSFEQTYKSSDSADIDFSKVSDSEIGSGNQLKLGAFCELPKIALLVPKSFEIADKLGCYSEGSCLPEASNYYLSGGEAEYLILRMDITNLTSADADPIKAASTKAVFDNEYQYGGWLRQMNYDNHADEGSAYESSDKGKQNKRFSIAEKDRFPLGPLYTGHYIFGVMVPALIWSAVKNEEV